MQRAAIYARLSEDRTGDGLGVDRQLSDCRRLAEERGWTVTREFVDRGLSAYSGKERPGFASLLAGIASGEFEAVLAYHQDRLTRTPAEFEAFLTACEAGGVKSFRTVTGLTQIGEGDSVMVARIYAAVARNQSDAASRRIRRKNDERAESGLPHISGERPYGYELDRMTIVHEEAAIIRALADRFIAGESLGSLALWLQRQGFRTATGQNDWRTPTLRNLLKSPRLAGLREHRGRVVGPAAWPAIITEAQHEQINARLRASAERHTRTPRRYLLSGKVFCDLCGSKMVSSPDGGRRRYGCRRGADFTGCGKVYINADPLERLVSDALLARLSGPRLLDRIADRSGPDVGELLDRQSGLQRRLDDLAAAYGGEQISMKEWLIARRPIEAALAAARAAYAEAADITVLSDFVHDSSDLEAAWTSPEMTLPRQAAILSKVIDRVVVRPAQKPSNRLDPNRVDIRWLA